MAITEEQKKSLSEMKNTPYGRALMAYLDEELLELRDITKTKSWEETLGRKFAVETIKKLFAFISQDVNPKKEKTRYD